MYVPQGEHDKIQLVSSTYGVCHENETTIDRMIHRFIADGKFSHAILGRQHNLIDRLLKKLSC